MAMTIYVVDSENVALLIGNVFTFVLEIHQLICACSLLILPIPKNESKPTFWIPKLQLYLHLVIHDSKAVGVKLASDLKMKKRVTHNQKRKKEKTSTSNSYHCILFKVNLSLH